MGRRSVVAAVVFGVLVTFVVFNAVATPGGGSPRVVTSAPSRDSSLPPATAIEAKLHDPPPTKSKKTRPPHRGAEQAASTPSKPEPTVVLADGSFRLPYVYPMHQHLPAKDKIEAGISGDQLSAHRNERCLRHAAPILFDPPTTMKAAEEPLRSAALEKEFDFPNPTAHTFYAEGTEELGEGGRPWWVPISAVSPNSVEHPIEPLEAASADGVDRMGEGLDFGEFPDEQYDAEGNLPCTEQVQRRLWRHQHPTSCDNARFLVSRLKEGAHGIGSAVTLVAHDFLSALILGRVLVIDHRTPWYFSSSSCGASRRGWDCLFVPPSPCAVPSSHAMVASKGDAQRSSSRAIRKKSFDIPGLARHDIPTPEQFFGGYEVGTRGRCYTAVKRWLRDPANTYVMGTFEKGADPLLFMMMAQVTRYLMRAPQPWFRAMLDSHFASVRLLSVVGRATTQLTQPAPLSETEAAKGTAKRKAPMVTGAASTTSPFGVKSAMVVYVQERGEIAKYREYYNAFGCHTVDNSLFVRYVTTICNATAATIRNARGSINADHQGLPCGGAAANHGACGCLAYISGNTPVKGYEYVKDELERAGVGVLSTWQHPRLSSSQESQRWGASAAFASWVDLYAGVAATGWVCTVQSNWCRVINFLRLTSGRAQCPFVDVGALMISSGDARAKYCVVKNGWPTKPFGGRIA